FGAAALVSFVLLLTWLGRDTLAGKNERKPTAESSAIAAGAGQHELATLTVGRTLATLLVQPALWGAFLFFAFTAMALSAVQNYTVPMLGDVYGIDKVVAGTALSAYMLAGAVGMLSGGFLVGATASSVRIVAISLFLAGLLLVVLAMG